MSSYVLPILRKISKVPLHAGNVLLGGNTIDALSKIQDPKVQRILRRAVKPKGFINHKRIGDMVAKTGHKKAMMTYGSERLKTHTARAVAGGAIAAYAYRKHKAMKAEAQQRQAQAQAVAAAYMHPSQMYAQQSYYY